MTTQEFIKLNQEKNQFTLGDIVDVFVEKPLLDIKVVQTIKEQEEVPFESIKIENDQLKIKRKNNPMRMLKELMGEEE